MREYLGRIVCDACGKGHTLDDVKVETNTILGWVKLDLSTSQDNEGFAQVWLRGEYCSIACAIKKIQGLNGTNQERRTA